MKKRAFRPVVCDAKLEDRVVPQAAGWWWGNPAANTIALNRFLLQSSLGFNNFGFNNPFLFNRFGLVGTGAGFTTAAGANVVNAISLDWNAPVTGAFGGTAPGLSQGTARGGAIPLVQTLVNNYLILNTPGGNGANPASAAESIAAVIGVLGNRLPQGLASASAFVPGGGLLFNQLIAPTTQYGAILAQLRTVQGLLPNFGAGAGNALALYYLGSALPNGAANVFAPAPLVANTLNTANLTAAANQSVQIAQNFVRVI